MRENPSEIEKKLDEDAMLYNYHLVVRQTKAHHKKPYLPFRLLLNVGIDPNFQQKSFPFFFGFIQRKISLSGEKKFSLATPSAIIYQVKLRYMS